MFASSSPPPHDCPRPNLTGPERGARVSHQWGTGRVVGAEGPGEVHEGRQSRPTPRGGGRARMANVESIWTPHDLEEPRLRKRSGHPWEANLLMSDGDPGHRGSGASHRPSGDIRIKRRNSRRNSRRGKRSAHPYNPLGEMKTLAVLKRKENKPLLFIDDVRELGVPAGAPWAVRLFDDRDPLGRRTKGVGRTFEAPHPARTNKKINTNNCR